MKTKTKKTNEPKPYVNFIQNLMLSFGIIGLGLPALAAPGDEQLPNSICTVGAFDDNEWDADGMLALAPTGVLRVGINYGNPNNAIRNPATHVLSGVAVDLSCRLASRLGVPLVFTGPGPGYPGIPPQTADFNAGNFDVGFSHDPRSRPTNAIVAHTHIIVENHFLVPANSPFQTGTPAELDQPGVKIAVGFGNAPDMFLRPILKYATLVDINSMGAPLTVPQAIKLLTTGQVQAFAGSVSVELPFTPNFRILPTPFLLAQLAMFVNSSNPVGQHSLSVFVEWAKKKGYIQEAINAAGLVGVTVPPPQRVGGVGDDDIDVGGRHDFDDQSDDGDDPDFVP